MLRSSSDNYGQERARSVQPRRNSNQVSNERAASAQTQRAGSEAERQARARRTRVESTHPRSTFKACLTSVPVPDKMLVGIKVIKVSCVGKTKSEFLTLSQDKFTVYVTTTKIKNNKGENGVFRPILRKVTSIGSNNGDEHEYERAIDVGSIIRIQVGQNTLRFELARKYRSKISSPKRGKLEAPNLDPNKCFSIFFVGGRTVDFMIHDEESNRDEIVDALERLMLNYAKAKLKVADDVILLRYIWLDVDRDKSDSINSSEFASVLNRINYMMKRVESNRLYNSFTKLIGLNNHNRRDGLSFEQCSIILHKVKRDSTWKVKPVRQIFFDLFGELMNNGKTRETVSADSFLRKFMLTKQGESNTEMKDVDRIFRSLNELEIASVATNLSMDDDTMRGTYIDQDRFEAYLISKENDVYDPAKEVFNQISMDRPFSEFWIHSSHNTYLSGNQWKSMSSVEMYMEALHSGCRCLELDCWDGERDSEQIPIPDIYHGHTITSRITFRDVILGIKVFLNGNPDCYPLILSLENHCSIPFQEIMAQCMVEIFADSLFVPNEESLHGSIPSAEMLRGKVVLKGQRITESKDSEYNDIDSDSDDSEIGDEFALKDNIPLKPKAPSTKVSPELSRITYLHSVRVKNFQESAKNQPFHMHSFSESRARKYRRKKEQRASWISYNKTHITRTYPSLNRVDSSNYSPMSAWSAGCQLVAINLQTPDFARRLNDGRFRENGGCGYVLKPPAVNGANVAPPQPFIIYIKVLAGYCLPKPKGKKRGECIDPYVHVCLYDVPVDGGKEIVTGQYTNKVSNNGFNPIWYQMEDFEFKVQNPDVAMLQLSVWDKDRGPNDFIASSSVPVSCVREGYRGVKLFDANHTRSGPFESASLLIEVKIKKGEDVMMW